MNTRIFDGRHGISRSMRALAVVVLGIFAAWHAAPARAQEEPSTSDDASSTSESSEMREVGGEATFRRIERFPDRGRSDSDSTSNGGASVLPDELRRAVVADDWAEVQRRIEGADLPASSELTASEAEFLAGYAAYRREEYRTALERFASVLQEATTLRDYAAYYAARSAAELGRHQEAVLHAARVPVSSLLHPDGLLLLGRELIEVGTPTDLERAEAVFRAHLEHYSDDARRHEARYHLAEVLLDRGRWESAAEHGLRLLEEAPLSDEAEQIRESLNARRDELPEAYRKRLESPTREMRMAYFRALFEHHRSTQLLDELPSVAEGWLDGTTHWCRALYWIGRSHTKLRQHEEAAGWYERILEECRGVEPFEKKALYLVGKGYWNIGQKEKALARFEDLWTRFDDHSYADDAMYFAARIHRERGEDERTRELARQQVDRHPNGDMASDAHWLIVRQDLARHRYRAVVDYIDQLDRTGEQHRYTRGRLRYFRAVALQRLDEIERARDGYLEVARRHPFGYYGLLALNRLADLEGVDARTGADLCSHGAGDLCRDVFGDATSRGDDGEAPGETWQLPDDVRRRPSYRRGSTLLRLGLRELAAREFQHLFDRVSGDDRALRALADLLDRAGAHSLASRLPLRIGGWRSSYPDTEARRYWTIAYPRAFRGVVEQWSSRRGLPDALVYAVMRKESRFEPAIGSSAGARGLMQLMPETARSVAEDVDLEGFDVGDLVHPATNVQLGTAYLETLSGRTNAHPTLMAASYNGGYGNVSSWLEERGELPLDLWVEDVPWGQTRRYAKMVMANYWVYGWLYGGARVPHLPMVLSE